MPDTAPSAWRPRWERCSPTRRLDPARHRLHAERRASLIEDIGCRQEQLPRRGGVGRLLVPHIQGTPDLLPGDVTGTMVPHGGFELRFRPGRSSRTSSSSTSSVEPTTRTQSSLLEATEEARDGRRGRRELPSPFCSLPPRTVECTAPIRSARRARPIRGRHAGRGRCRRRGRVLTGRRHGRNILRSVSRSSTSATSPPLAAVVGRTYLADGIALRRGAARGARGGIRVAGSGRRRGIALVDLAKSHGDGRPRTSSRRRGPADAALAACSWSMAMGQVRAGREVVAGVSLAFRRRPPDGAPVRIGARRPRVGLGLGRWTGDRQAHRRLRSSSCSPPRCTSGWVPHSPATSRCARSPSVRSWFRRSRPQAPVPDPSTSDRQTAGVGRVPATGR